jgi:hypothetical protein
MFCQTCRDGLVRSMEGKIVRLYQLVRRHRLREKGLEIHPLPDAEDANPRESRCVQNGCSRGSRWRLCGGIGGCRTAVCRPVRSGIAVQRSPRESVLDFVAVTPRKHTDREEWEPSPQDKWKADDSLNRFLDTEKSAQRPGEENKNRIPESRL